MRPLWRRPAVVEYGGIRHLARWTAGGERRGSGGVDGLIDVTDLPSLREPIEVAQLG